MDQKLENIESTQGKLLAGLAIFVALIASGGVLGIVLQYQEGRRSTKAFQMSLDNELVSRGRGEEMYRRYLDASDLSLAGERAAQTRADEVHSKFLDSSQRTLRLVNDTLEVAKEASERASRTVDEKAKSLLRNVEESARELLRQALLSEDFKAIVEKPEFSTRVQEIATELSYIEGTLRIQDIPLPDVCLLIKGIDKHLREEPRAAITELRRASESSQDAELRLLSQYWLGYEANNLGWYDEAANTFRRIAQDSPDTLPRSFELRRIWVESRFFEAAAAVGTLGLDKLGERDDMVRAIQACERQLGDIEDELITKDTSFDRVRSQVQTTRGNVWMWLALSEPKEAQTYWQQAADCFERAGRGSLWSLFGLLEAHQRLGRPVNSEEYQAVADAVMERVSQRLEPRSKVLLFSTRFIAYCRQPERTIPELEAAFGDVLSAMGRVSALMKVYSQFRKCNVAIADLNTELRDFYMSVRHKHVDVGEDR